MNIHRSFRKELFILMDFNTGKRTKNYLGCSHLLTVSCQPTSHTVKLSHSLRGLKEPLIRPSIIFHHQSHCCSFLFVNFLGHFLLSGSTPKIYLLIFLDVLFMTFTQWFSHTRYSEYLHISLSIYKNTNYIQTHLRKVSKSKKSK